MLLSVILGSYGQKFIEKVSSPLSINLYSKTILVIKKSW